MNATKLNPKSPCTGVATLGRRKLLVTRLDGVQRLMEELNHDECWNQGMVLELSLHYRATVGPAKTEIGIYGFNLDVEMEPSNTLPTIRWTTSEKLCSSRIFLKPCQYGRMHLSSHSGPKRQRGRSFLRFNPSFCRSRSQRPSDVVETRLRASAHALSTLYSLVV